jgi:hypothetical protein
MRLGDERGNSFRGGFYGACSLIRHGPAWVGVYDLLPFLDWDTHIQVSGHRRFPAGAKRCFGAMGGIVPLALLPGGVMQVFRFVPFTHVVYTPAMLLMGKVTIHEGLMGFAVLAVSAALMAAINHAAFRHLRVRYDGVGI